MLSKNLRFSLKSVYILKKFLADPLKFLFFKNHKIVAKSSLDRMMEK